VAPPKSKVESLARALRRLSVVLLVVWIVAAVAAVAWVEDEFQGGASLYRYITAIADVATFLIAAVLAYVGSAVVQAIGRVRSSIINAIFEREDEFDLERLGEPHRLDGADHPVDWRPH
jgi:ketol-acid reductoisomerase